MAPLEPWEKVFVSDTALADTVHGVKSCIFCHEGSNSSDKSTAHTDMIPDPSDDHLDLCTTCHSGIMVQTSTLHYTLGGYDTLLAARSSSDDPALWQALQEMREDHCSDCHTTCGQCHVSQPASLGGGLLNGHEFIRTPVMTSSCTPCHGSRVGDEYLGNNEGVSADVHFTLADMSCVDCHTGVDLHGATQDPETTTHRYDGAQQPSCEQCHAEIGGPADTIRQHTIHTNQLSCQACHSLSYKNCYGCHTRLTPAGEPYFELEESEMGFYLGLNTLQNVERPYQYVPVRHVPIVPDSFAEYGDNLLPNFDNAPTWGYTTPHNIQRITPQTESCDTCHGNPDIFLTADKVDPEELTANSEVIVEQVPGAVP